MSDTPYQPFAPDTRICRVCDGGPGNDGNCLCGLRKWDATPPNPEGLSAENRRLIERARALADCSPNITFPSRGSARQVRLLVDELATALITLAARAQSPSPAQDAPHETPEFLLSYAQDLARHTAEKYRVSAFGLSPYWKPFDDLGGVLTQLDNMLSGMTVTATPEILSPSPAPVFAAAPAHPPSDRDGAMTGVSSPQPGEGVTAAPATPTAETGELVDWEAQCDDADRTLLNVAGHALVLEKRLTSQSAQIAALTEELTRLRALNATTVHETISSRTEGGTISRPVEPRAALQAEESDHGE